MNFLGIAPDKGVIADESSGNDVENIEFFETTFKLFSNVDESSEQHNLPRYTTCQFSGLELKDQFDEICNTCPEIRVDQQLNKTV